MKKSIKNTLGLLVLALMTFSFTPIKKSKKEIATQSSTVAWKGYKVTGSHNGKIDIKSGFLTFEDAQLSGGSVIIDMTTISSLDLSGDYKNKLEGHLKSDDFFGVQKFTTSNLVFTKVKSTGKNSYKVKGKLTIKGITKNVNFNISIYGNKATASLKIDRTDFNVKYGSSTFFDNLKDKAIYDEFDLVVDLEFKK